MSPAPSPAPALKEIFNRPRLKHIANETKAVYPSFDADRFLKLAAKDLDALSIMQRLRRVAESLHATLPNDYLKAIAILKKLAPRIGHNFVGIVPCEYVALYGEKHFDESMQALKFFTSFGSGEFAIRHFLKRDLQRTLAVMEKWAEDENEHVRRLASEGSRPRLPWSFRLDALIDDPSLTQDILEKLKADPSPYVRKSVANHLNDITKDNPAWVLERLSSWPMSEPHTAWIVKHALRTLIKRGNRDALAIIGATDKPKVGVEAFKIAPRKIKLGGSLSLSFAIRSKSSKPQSLVVDYAIHYVKKSGRTTRKVFKLKSFELPARGMERIDRKQVIKDFTTRVHSAGRHEVELLVNGQCLARSDFDLAC